MDLKDINEKFNEIANSVFELRNELMTRLQRGEHFKLLVKKNNSALYYQTLDQVDALQHSKGTVGNCPKCGNVYINICDWCGTTEAIINKEKPLEQDMVDKLIDERNRDIDAVFVDYLNKNKN